VRPASRSGREVLIPAGKGALAKPPEQSPWNTNNVRPLQYTLPGMAMCWKCQEIDKVILHYRVLGARVTDKLTLEGLQQLIEKLEAEKKALHPEQA
jgi:hypothetical protein